MNIRFFILSSFIFIIFVLFKFGFTQEIDTSSSSKKLSHIDTLNVKLIEEVKIQPNEESFLNKYGSLIGALIGAFMAGIIAIYSVWKTNKNNLKLENTKFNIQKEIDENRYCGLLFSILSDLYAHEKISKNLDYEISGFLAYFEKNLKIPTDKIFSELPIEFMKTCRNKILDFSKFETTSFSILTHYINVIDTLQKDLNLKRVKEARIDIKDENLLIEGMNGYFEQMSNTIKTLNTLRSELMDKILEIIKSYPQSDVNDLIDKLKNKND